LRELIGYVAKPMSPGSWSPLTTLCLLGGSSVAQNQFPAFNLAYYLEYQYPSCCSVPDGLPIHRVQDCGNSRCLAPTGTGTVGTYWHQYTSEMGASNPKEEILRPTCLPAFWIKDIERSIACRHCPPSLRIAIASIWVRFSIQIPCASNQEARPNGSTYTPERVYAYSGNAACRRLVR
jgi:hypothetical protein